MTTISSVRVMTRFVAIGMFLLFAEFQHFDGKFVNEGDADCTVV